MIKKITQWLESPVSIVTEGTNAAMVMYACAAICAVSLLDWITNDWFGTVAAFVGLTLIVWAKVSE
jgi:hypothetical protein